MVYKIITSNKYELHNSLNRFFITITCFCTAFSAVDGYFWVLYIPSQPSVNLPTLYECSLVPTVSSFFRVILATLRQQTRGFLIRDSAIQEALQIPRRVNVHHELPPSGVRQDTAERDTVLYRSSRDVQSSLYCSASMYST